MISNDRLVTALFEAIKKEDASPEERRIALVRAGIIAQTYGDDKSLTDAVFGSGHFSLKQDGDLNLGSGGVAVNGGTH